VSDDDQEARGIDPGEADATREASDGEAPNDRRLPRWVIPAILLFWLGFLLTIVVRHMFDRLSTLMVMLLVSMFLTFAVEPGVNRLAARGWRRGTATLSILFGVLFAFLVFVVSVGTLLGTQVAELLSESEVYITDTVRWINNTFGTEIDPQDVVREFTDPDGSVQQFIRAQGDEAVRLSVAAVTVIFQALSVLLFTYYLVAEGPKLRRTVCSYLPEERQRLVLSVWDLAIEKTGGYIYSRTSLAILSAIVHSIAFALLDVPFPLPLGLWVGVLSQFIPVIGTYIAGALPVLIATLDSPRTGLWVLVVVVVYQQVENYWFAPKITARTMELHVAVAFGAVIAGGAVLGVVGALLALPFTATVQAFISTYAQHHDVHEETLAESRQRRGQGRGQRRGPTHK